MARLTDDQKEAIRNDLRSTHGTPEGALRKVAERHGVGMTSVRVLRDELQLSGGEAARAKTKNATEALRTDLAARRAALSERFVAAAERALDDMDSPAVIFNFGGKDNTYNERAVSRPPTGDRRNLAIIAATMFDKHKVADQYDAQQGLSAAVDDWLADRLGKREDGA